jgi:hypothetical protein
LLCERVPVCVCVCVCVCVFGGTKGGLGCGNWSISPVVNPPE